VTLIVIFIALILLYTLVSKRLDRTILTAPIVFAGAGILVLLVLPSLREQQGNIEVFMTVAEVGLVLLLFMELYARKIAELDPSAPEHQGENKDGREE